ncbi:MAG TPA: oligosaccharide flippase family protein, partial [Aggregatilineaceae bacterium]|nr:oligosaccharide flippase family protein [Aggregatilineaceae bacterium]
MNTISSPSTGARRDLAALLGRSGTYAISDILKQAINFLLLPLYTAYMSTADYGVLSIALAAGSVLEVLFGLGLRAALARLYFDQKSDLEIRRFLGTLTVFLVLFSVGLTVLLLLIGPLVWPLFGQDVAFAPYIVLILMVVVVNTLGLAVVLPLYYVRGQAVRYAMYSLSSFLLATAGTLLFVVGLEQGAAGALWGRLAGGLIMLGPTVWIVARQVQITLKREILIPALLFSLPLVPHMLFSWVLNFSDRIILGKFVSLGDVGIYTVGYQFGLVVGVVITAISNAWAPWYFRASTEGRREHIPAFGTYFVMLTAALALVVTVFAREAVAVMTAKSYHDAWTIVPLVTVGYFVNGLAGRYADVLMLHKKTAAVGLTTVAAGVANIGFNLLVIPELGIVGAAYGTIFGYAVRLVLTVYYAAQTHDLPFEHQRIAAICVVAGVIAVPGAAFTTGLFALDVVWKAGLY